MTEKEIALFNREIRLSKNYLEYGAGGSTKIAASVQSVQKIVSVESDPGFLESSVFPDPMIQKAMSDARMKFLLPYIGPSLGWGIPKDKSMAYLWPNYALCPYQSVPLAPDLIVVDGRFRVACCLVAALQAPEATILLHDFTRRPEYRILKKYFTIVEMVDTLVKLRRNTNFNDRKAQKYLKKYLYFPCDDPLTAEALLRRFIFLAKQLIKRVLLRQVQA